jgi:hypothetical protein
MHWYSDPGQALTRYLPLGPSKLSRQIKSARSPVLFFSMSVDFINECAFVIYDTLELQECKSVSCFNCLHFHIANARFLSENAFLVGFGMWPEHQKQNNAANTTNITTKLVEKHFSLQQCYIFSPVLIEYLGDYLLTTKIFLSACDFDK